MWVWALVQLLLMMSLRFSLRLRILWHVTPVQQVQEQIVAVDWFFVVEHIVDVPTSL